MRNICESSVSEVCDGDCGWSSYGNFLLNFLGVGQGNELLAVLQRWPSYVVAVLRGFTVYVQNLVMFEQDLQLWGVTEIEKCHNKVVLEKNTDFVKKRKNSSFLKI